MKCRTEDLRSTSTNCVFCAILRSTGSLIDSQADPIQALDTVSGVGSTVNCNRCISSRVYKNTRVLKFFRVCVENVNPPTTHTLSRVPPSFGAFAIITVRYCIYIIQHNEYHNRAQNLF